VNGVSWEKFQKAVEGFHNLPERSKKVAAAVFAIIALIVLVICAIYFFKKPQQKPEPGDITETPQTLPAVDMPEFFNLSNMNAMYQSSYSTAIAQRDSSIAALLSKEKAIHFTDEQYQIICSDKNLRSFYDRYTKNKSSNNARDMADRAATLADKAEEKKDLYAQEKMLELARSCAIRMMVHDLSQNDYFFREGTLRLGTLTYKIALLHNSNKEPYLLAAVVYFEKCFDWISDSHRQFFNIKRDSANAHTNLSDAYWNKGDKTSSVACAMIAAKHYQDLLDAGKSIQSDISSASRMRDRANSNS